MGKIRLGRRLAIGAPAEFGNVRIVLVAHLPHVGHLPHEGQGFGTMGHMLGTLTEVLTTLPALWVVQYVCGPV